MEGINLTEYTTFLEQIYQLQLQAGRSDYLAAHCLTRGGIQRQVLAARIYLPWIKGRVLDWGCNHAPDACLIRKYSGDEIEIHGCDVHEPTSACFSVFHQAARLTYQQVEHPYAIPYDNNFFETVIGDGVLEHVPNHGESLKELYRILKPNGLLVLSCLPNRYSYLENLAWLLGLPHHLRTYTLREARQLLLAHGFEPIYSCFLQMMPTMSGLAMVNRWRFMQVGVNMLWAMNRLLEPCWPLNRLASNILLLARKRSVVSWTGESLSRRAA